MLKISTRENKLCCFTIALDGSLDTETHAKLDAHIQSLLTEGAARAVTLDMAKLKYISSMGVRSVLSARKELAKRQSELLIINMQPQVEKVFEVINLLPSLKVFASVAEMDAYLDKIQRDAGSAQ